MGKVFSFFFIIIFRGFSKYCLIFLVVPIILKASFSRGFAMEDEVCGVREGGLG